MSASPTSTTRLATGARPSTPPAFPPAPAVRRAPRAPPPPCEAFPLPPRPPPTAPRWPRPSQVHPAARAAVLPRLLQLRHKAAQVGACARVRAPLQDGRQAGDYLGQQRGGERVGEAAPAAGGERAARAGRRDALGEGCVGARAAQGQGGAVEAASAAVGAADQPHRAGPRRPSATPLAVLRSGSGGPADGEAHREHARPTADPPPVRVGLA
mmetsp:Transcript_19948/g.65974  ORF Transcript_19948/g.65974 Transcript_19948/m.65974 type:complete len:212 (-) Transcript_19948:43-678(-)